MSIKSKFQPAQVKKTVAMRNTSLMRTSIHLLPLSFRKKYSSYWHTSRLVLSKIKRLFIHPSFPRQKDGKIYLHLGCGSFNHPNFINIDYLPAPHIHYIRSIDNLSIFRDGSVDLIYASHCLEHFPHGQIITILQEWFRVLKKDGILRISIPNFDVLLNIYQNNGNNIDLIQDMLMGGQDYKFNFHMTVFNREHLTSLLDKVGFSIVREWQPGKDNLTPSEDTSNMKININGISYFISLNIEAVK